jgi:hypothetical protein
MNEFFLKLDQVAKEERAKELFMRLVADYDDQAKQGVLLSKFKFWRAQVRDMNHKDEQEEKAKELFMRLVADYDDQGKQGVMRDKWYVWKFKMQEATYKDAQEQKAKDLFMRLVADYDDQGKQGVMKAKFKIWSTKVKHIVKLNKTFWAYGTRRKMNNNLGLKAYLWNWKTIVIKEAAKEMQGSITGKFCKTFI